jgi:hypothetical protein
MRRLLGIAALAAILMLSLRSRPAPAAPALTSMSAAQSEADAIGRLKADGVVAKVDLAHGRMWVTPKFRAMSFADQESTARVMHDVMPDASHADLLLVNARSGAYYGSYDPGLGLVVTKGATIISDAGIFPK